MINNLPETSKKTKSWSFFHDRKEVIPLANLLTHVLLRRRQPSTYQRYAVIRSSIETNIGFQRRWLRRFGRTRSETSTLGEEKEQGLALEPARRIGFFFQTDSVLEVMNRDSAEEFVTELREHDVLMGRGSPSTEYSGNLNFRQLVKDRRADYLKCTRRQEKHQVAQEIVATVHQRGGRFLEKIDTMEEAQRLKVPPRTQAWRVIPASTALFIKVKQLMRDVGEETKSKRRQRREAQRKKQRDQKATESSTFKEDAKSGEATLSGRSRVSGKFDDDSHNSENERSEETSASEEHRKPTAAMSRSAPLNAQLSRSNTAGSRELASSHGASRQAQAAEMSIPSMFRLRSRPPMPHPTELAIHPAANLQLLHGHQVPQLLQPSFVAPGAANLVYPQTAAPQALILHHQLSALPSSGTTLPSSLRRGPISVRSEQPASAQQLSSDEVAALLTLVQAPAVPPRIKRDLLSLLMSFNLQR